MKPLIPSATGLVLGLLFALAHASPPTVNPEAPDLDPETTAKIMKEKAKRNPSAQPAGNSVGGAANSSPDCGTVNIGNTDKKGPIGNIMGGPTTVIITGDVINTAKCK
jgi:hypothetical protein